MPEMAQGLDIYTSEWYNLLLEDNRQLPLEVSRQLLREVTQSLRRFLRNLRSQSLRRFLGTLQEYSKVSLRNIPKFILEYSRRCFTYLLR